jgi:hypothetical protein
MRAMIDSESDSDSEEEMMELKRLLRIMNKVASSQGSSFDDLREYIGP